MSDTSHPMTFTQADLDLPFLQSRRRASAMPRSYCWTRQGTYIDNRDPAELLASGREIQATWRVALLGMAKSGYSAFLVYLGSLVFAQIDLDPYTSDVWCKLFDATYDEYPDN